MVFIEDQGQLIQLQSTPIILTVVFLLSVALAFYLLTSFGFYRMAVNKQISNPALAFVPFVRYALAGKLFGTAVFFGKKTEKMGVITAITVALYVVLTVVYDFLAYSVIYFAVRHGFTVVFSLSEAEILIGEDAQHLSSLYMWQQQQYGQAGYTALVVLQWVSYAASIANLLVSYSFWYSLFFRYKPAMAGIYAFISAVFPALEMPFFTVGGIFVFVLRNKKQFEPKKIYVNVNPNGYQNSYGGGGFDPYGRDNGQEPNDPFEEFNGKNKESENKNDDDPFGF
ncbi:MAG: hypothetical protein MJ072_03755 [Clostridia bacterium]|nr:hypothetical protein [Clostridia bacterium]